MLHQYLADLCNAKHSRTELSYQLLAKDYIRLQMGWHNISKRANVE